MHAPDDKAATPLASLSLDLDNLWSYMKIHGDSGWESYPSYLDVLSPIVVEQLRQHRLTITVFIVGRDASLEKNEAALRVLAEGGHEVGNHSLSHEPWFHEYAYDDVVREIGEAEEHIERATGKRPRGFRGPGFSLSADTLRVLKERGYAYDCSTFPTFLGPLARAYYFWNTRGMPEAEKEKRKKLYGTASEGLRPIEPYLWNVPVGDGTLLEIPVTTMPFFRVPMHMSYVLYLAGYSKAAALAYLRSAIAMCRTSGVEPSFLLHPLDFLGGDRVSELSFFPGMRLPTSYKLELFDEAMQLLSAAFRVVPMEEHARSLLSRSLPRRALA